MRLITNTLLLCFTSITLAISQIIANKMRSFLTVTGIIIGVASVAIVISVLTSFEKSFFEDMNTLGASKLFIHPHQPESKKHRQMSMHKIRFMPEHFKDIAENCPDLAKFSRIADTRKNAKYGSHTSENVSIKGVDPDWHDIENTYPMLGRQFDYLDNKQARKVCIITQPLLDELNLPKDCIGYAIKLGPHSYRIIGVLNNETTTNFIPTQNDEKNAYIPFNTLWQWQRPWINAIGTASSPETSSEAAAQVEFFLKKTRQIKPGQPDNFMVRIPDKIIELFKSIASVILGIAACIVGISLLVGGIGIMNIMLVSVSERTREIGLRKAIGAKPAIILLQFLTEAVILCLLGGIIGLLCAQLFMSILTLIPQLKVQSALIPTWAITLSLTFTSAIGIVFGFFPALKAASLDPIEALRHE